ncbi:MAG: translocation/assembly module TamB domain-containing protein [Myxococcales bacterium]
MSSRILLAAGLAAAVVSGVAIAFLRTDFVANNLCAYAVATIEEATAAQVKVASCSVEPEKGKLVIDGLQISDPVGRIEVHIVRVFAQVMVRPILQRVRLERLEIDHPEVRLSLDQAASTSPAKGGQCLPDVLDRFEFGRVKVRKASFALKSGGVRVEVPHAGVAIDGRRGKLEVSVATRGGSVEVPGRTIGLVSTRTAGTVDLRGTGSVDLERADVIGTEASAFVKGTIQGLCDPQIDMSANLRADDLGAATARLLPGLLGGVKGALSADATVSIAAGKPRVKGDLRVKALALEGFAPGDARIKFDVTPERVSVDRFEIPAGKGVIAGSAELDLEQSALPLTGEVSLRDAELQEILRKVGVPHSLVVLKASGRGQIRGTLSPLLLSGETSFDLADFAVLDDGYDKRGAHKMFEFSRGRVATSVAIDREKVVLRKTTVEAGTSRVDVESTFFVDQRRGMQLLGHGESVDLDDFGGHLGPLPAHGKATFAARVAGPYADVTIDSSASVQGFRLLDLSLGDVSTQLGFGTRSMKLVLDQIRGRKDRSTYGGRIALDMKDKSIPIDAHLELPDAYLHDMVDLAIGLVPTLSTVHDATDVDGHFAGVLDVKGPAAGPDGVAKLVLDDVSLWDEKFDHGSARLSLHGQEPRLQIESFELAHRGARLTMAGRFGPEWQLDMDAQTENFTLADLDAAESARLTGPLVATAHVGGAASHPLIDASVRFADAKAGKARLGDGDLALKVDDKAMTWRGTVGTHSLQGQARLVDVFHYTSTAKVRVPNLKEYLDVFAPGVEIQSGSLAADLALEGSLLAWRRSSGRIDVSELKVVRNDMPFENDGLAALSFGPDGLLIHKLAVRAPYTTAQMSGSRGRDGKLDLRLAASVDGRVLQNVVPDVEHASGTFLIQAAVGGTTGSPTVLGNLRVEDGAVSLRGLPVAARNLDGSISFSQDALVIDSLSGKLNNGDARVSGGMEMEKLAPKKIDVQVHVSDVNVKLQEALNATLDGDLTLLGPPLEPVLGGNLIVSRMKYTEDIDIEKSLLDFSRRPPTPKVLTKSAVLVHFDLDVHLSRGVRVENNLARTDLKGDLKVTGTSRALGLLGSVNTVHGTASFRGNEFQIEQGVLSFNDRQRIRPSFDLQANAQVKDYKVRLHAFGTPGEPHLTLNSDPALAEADLGFLLAFGFVSTNLQQASFNAADSGLAIGIEALNKATGFSEEVRRFIPKNAILRDPNIDFASDFSVATNRLEPMARFSSHVVNDKMDLKILEGLTTRRYRGVISYQLSDALSTRLQLDNEHITTGTGTDFGIDLHLKWEGE